MSRKKIAVTGATGQLGRELKKLSAADLHRDYTFLNRSVLPLENLGALRDYFSANEFDYCINCGAYTAVDKAEADSGNAFVINGEAPGIIAAALADYHGTMIQLSTDYVFDGSSETPLTENGITAPLNVYGASKLQGEKEALANNAQTLVIRTSWVYSEYGHNFVKTMMRLMKEKTSIQVVDDQEGSPTYAGDLAAAILKIIASGKIIPGIYHYSNEGKASWFDFATAIKKETGSACIVQPVGSAHYPTPAKRPRYSLLDKSKIKKNYGLTIPGWQESLSHCIDALKSGQV